MDVRRYIYGKGTESSYKLGAMYMGRHKCMMKRRAEGCSSGETNLLAACGRSGDVIEAKGGRRIKRVDIKVHTPVAMETASWWQGIPPNGMHRL